MTYVICWNITSYIDVIKCKDILNLSEYNSHLVYNIILI